MPALLDTLIASSTETRFGPVSVFATASDGVVRTSGFGSPVQVAGAHARPLGGRDWVAGSHPDATEALRAWEDGEFQALDAVATEQQGGPFMLEAWRELHAVPAGQVVTYQELAERAGSPRAMRAAGQACARNALAPFVPCHRVIASTGIGNFGYGVGLKRDLLIHEGIPAELLA